MSIFLLCAMYIVMGAFVSGLFDADERTWLFQLVTMVIWPIALAYEAGMRWVYYDLDSADDPPKPADPAEGGER